MVQLAAEKPRKFKHRDVRIVADVKAPPADVYRAATSARQLCAWWADRAETQIRNGGRFQFEWPEDMDKSATRGRGTFVDLDPGRKLSWLWEPDSLPRGVPLLTTLFLEPARAGCRVTLVHAGFPAEGAAAKAFSSYSRGWEDFVAKLALYVERGATCKGERLSLADLASRRRRRT
ncbi:MAG: SRPBCC domain-containing protein [Proteobacteria bacterium]|nr:SRPBCC domain-containing protein [Pseudomonadota bacterium]